MAVRSVEPLKAVIRKNGAVQRHHTGVACADEVVRASDIALVFAVKNMELPVFLLACGRTVPCPLASTAATGGYVLAVVILATMLTGLGFNVLVRHVESILLKLCVAPSKALSQQIVEWHLTHLCDTQEALKHGLLTSARFERVERVDAVDEADSADS